MSHEYTPVTSLVERLVNRLPHHSGSNFEQIEDDDIISLTKSTLVDISSKCIEAVIGALLYPLEEFAEQYSNLYNHPPHILRSEVYLLHVLADCFLANWDWTQQAYGDRGVEGRASAGSPTLGSMNGHSAKGLVQDGRPAKVRDSRVLPRALDSVLIGRVLQVMKTFLPPFSDEYALAARKLFPLQAYQYGPQRRQYDGDGTSSFRTLPGDTDDILEDGWIRDVLESDTRTIIEFISASNWQVVFDHLQTSLRLLQIVFPLHGDAASGVPVTEDDKNALATLRLVEYLWVDMSRLQAVISEVCNSFFHLRKTFKITLALALPPLIMTWAERHSEDFVRLHLSHGRADAGVDRLFDITHSLVENGNWRTTLQPLQVSLLLLVPDVFETAASMPSAGGKYLEKGDIPKAGSSIFKKVAFLEALRKAVRNGNPTAAYCLVVLLKHARHFDSEDRESGLFNYALDIYDDVRDAIFQKYAPGGELVPFEEDLLVAAFVSFIHLDADASIDRILSQCFASTSPLVYKSAFVRACCHIAQEEPSSTYSSLLHEVTRYVKSHLTFSYGQSTMAPVAQPKSSAIETRKQLTVCCLQFLHCHPAALFEDAPADINEFDDFFQESFRILLQCFREPDEDILEIVSSVTRKLLNGSNIFAPLKGSGIKPKDARQAFWDSTSLTILYMLEGTGTLMQRHNRIVRVLRDFLACRLRYIKSANVTMTPAVDRTYYDEAIQKLEAFFLVSLCSVDITICQTVTECIAVLCEECDQIEGQGVERGISPAFYRNVDIYKQLSSRNFRFTGIVAFQKRVRSLLQRLTFPNSSILKAWDVVFVRWLGLSRRMASLRQTDVVEDVVVNDWRNCSGLLASLAGVCVSTQALLNEDADVTGLRWIDRTTKDNEDETYLDRFLIQCVQLLASSNVRIREAIREVLSSELSAGLHLSLFKHLETELEELFETVATPNSRYIESKLVFTEQAISLLRTIVEKMGNPSDIGSSQFVDIGSLTLNFSTFVNSFPEGPQMLRIKIRLCQLCESITQKKELLNLRHDTRVRNQLLEILFNWIARPGSSRNDTGTSASEKLHNTEMAKLQKDLDRACLKALSDLTFRLPLQPPEGQTDADTSDLKSQMFHTYFNRFLSLISYGTVDARDTDTMSKSPAQLNTQSTENLAIVALSNLLSANIDVGLKHSLGIGYHEDVEIRAAFVTVLCNVLAQGTEFNNLSNVVVNEKYDRLIEVLTDDFDLTIALCDACPSTEVDEVTMALLNIFESRGLGFVLLEHLIKHEISETENEAELLRRNCVTTKMLSIYARWRGSAYLKTTLQKVLQRLVVTAQDLDLELDPARTASPEELQRNILQLRVVTKVFIDDICDSAEYIPVSFRKICSIISSSVLARFPDAKFTAVGAFIFLRFFCPAIVAPDAEGLVTATPSKDMRRGLLLIAKIIQNLANNVLFGAKESYMFPLNDFLTQNIYRVTTFLREISVCDEEFTMPNELDAFDFSSCVALHRFLFDNWDHVRQKIVARQKKGVAQGAHHSLQGRLLSETLRNLTSNLGPPPTDVSWNRPSVSMNSPPLYSRFQHFMLQNAGRSMENIISSQAVYDGGESKDGLSTICVILRNIDTENTDFDLLLYCYLKIASRMWHQPFNLLIDGTCYTGLNEPQDALFRKLDQLTPAELGKSLSRVYIYNMNCALRKCLRRILRLSSKNENSPFHPKNVEYHLVGNLNDLQAHFHLSQLQLPKETISVVTDARFVFQPVTRLSKTKGKIDVSIQVGNKFVQVTTTKRQEIVAGLKLSATVNDIFRLAELDEAPTSIQTEDDSAFGLRTEGGRIVMYFTSPRKQEILQAIHDARSRHVKDFKPPQDLQRLLRPQDVPGTLLNIALTNMASPHDDLRIASYNLLCTLCRTFKFAVKSSFMSSKDLYVPANVSKFIINVSKQIAASERQLTSDFLNEFFVAWDSFPLEQRPLSLAYLSPWILGLRDYVLTTEPDGEKGREKIASVLRRLIHVATTDNSLLITLEHWLWPEVCEDEVLVEIVLDELIKSALVASNNEEADIDVIAAILSSMRGVTIRGKLIARLRKALNRTSLRPTRALQDNAVWDEICVLLRLCLAVSFDGATLAHLYLPETAHIITMLANTGSANTRMLVHRLLVNTIHALCTSFSVEDGKLIRLKAILSSLSNSSGDFHAKFHGVFREGLLLPQTQDRYNSAQVLASTEALAILLADVVSLAAPTINLANAWRSRWMSLVASTAFQTNIAIQPRAFTVMGCLAREDVDDDLLYQVLVALKSTINGYTDERDNELLVSIITALSKMMEKLPTTSRYGLQLFWLALAVVRFAPVALFNCSVLFLEAVLLNISASGDFKAGRMALTLLQGRTSLEDTADLLDAHYGIHFSIDSLHFAICATVGKGLTDSATRSTSLKVLKTFLEITSASGVEGNAFPDDMTCLPYLYLTVFRVTTSEEARSILWVSGIKTEASLPANLSSLVDLNAIKDKELLLTAAIGLIDFTYMPESARAHYLNSLNELVEARPAVMFHLCEPLFRVLEEVLLNSHDARTLHAAQKLFCTLGNNPESLDRVHMSQLLADELDDLGFEGLWSSARFSGSIADERVPVQFTEKLISAIVS